ncbi:DUF3472 domain-containing protein [uncultured Prevotella sp.]|uniref:DUF3472 domain-containing protein n=1 Tax=uncultured Prevotella sp. TaxID=159272 RepID=UPI0026010767|nr:DUF3472 domain-containing protein [uncultured Prevotella sp.]
MIDFKKTAYCALIALYTINANATVYETELSAAQGYVETLDGKPGASGIYIPGEGRDNNGIATNYNSLSAWTNANACAVYYFHQPAATVTNTIKLNVKKGYSAKFQLTIVDPDAPDVQLFSKTFTANGTDSNVDVTVGDVTFKRSVYYRYRLECLSGNQNINLIRSFTFKTTATEKPYVANYLSSPSVHLYSWGSTDPNAPKGDAYDWCFMEIMLPQESDIIGTYAMALGVLNGYMGIQMNGYANDGSPRHDVLFSMWDDGSTDEDPNLPEYMRAGAVDWDPLTTTNRFGNEGTGVQTYRKGPYWTPGKYVQFITNCRPETTSYTTEVNGKPTVHTQHNMLVSAWFNALDGKGWQYMATVRKRNSTTYFDAWYSFLENYNASTGQANRIAYYRNGYMRARSNGKWYNRNSVGFGHTDGGDNTGARTDYGQGTTDNPADRTFFMQTGGYTSTNKTKTTVALATDYTPVDTINITPLNDRVLTAIANEKARIEKEQLFVDNLMDKTGWEAIEYSSEETAGEGTNGRAQQIVDSDDDTYWHPQWYGSTAQLPHYIVVDMQEMKNVGGFEIKMGDNANRHIKAYDIYGSTDNSDWTLLCSDDNAPAKSSFRVILDKAADIRYFKIVVRQTTAKDGPFLRIYEMNVASGAVATAVNHITVNNGQTSANGATYNISGQRISEDAKGIVIKNGKKYIKK